MAHPTSHYWIGHKNGYLFCTCGVASVYGIRFPLDIIEEMCNDYE